MKLLQQHRRRLSPSPDTPTHSWLHRQTHTHTLHSQMAPSTNCCAGNKQRMQTNSLLEANRKGDAVVCGISLNKSVLHMNQPKPKNQEWKIYNVHNVSGSMEFQFLFMLSWLCLSNRVTSLRHLSWFCSILHICVWDWLKRFAIQKAKCLSFQQVWTLFWMSATTLSETIAN